MSAPKWSVGFERIIPGVYVDAATRVIHFDLPEICRHVGVPPTPENQAMAEKIANDVVREVFPNAAAERTIHADPA